MKCAIMQPTYLPWLGYFDLIARSDVFVFLDDVQFAKRSWQQRNRVLINGEERFIAIPVQSKGKREQKICEAVTDEAQGWRKQHAGILKMAYGKHPHGAEMLKILSDVLDQGQDSLAAINEQLIREICAKLGLPAQFMRSSELPVEGKKSEYLLNICNYVGADTYLSAAGSRDYIEEEGLFAQSRVTVEYQSYEPKAYPQKGAEAFIPYMSVADLIANVGTAEAAAYI